MFGVGEQGGLTLSENFAACDRVLTTSLAEGFGLVFLESCLSQRPLLGRDLPEVTGDFVQHGVTFAGLRSRVDLPIDWLGRQELLDMFARTYGSTMNAYGRHALAQRDLEEGLDAKTRNGFVDFGDLDAALQERVLRRVCSDTHGLEALLATNPWLRDAVAARDAEYFAEAEKNAAVVRSEYSLEVSGRRLSQIYHAVMASSRQGPLGALTGGERILDAFLSLPRFRPVRI
jgi:glycosyltransferase involved in cell wall biosynthesis